MKYAQEDEDFVEEDYRKLFLGLEIKKQLDKEKEK